MSVRHWILAAGFLLGLACLLVEDGGTSWTDMGLLFAGGLVGIWAAEGERARARDRGVDLDPL